MVERAPTSERHLFTLFGERGEGEGEGERREREKRKKKKGKKKMIKEISKKCGR